MSEWKTYRLGEHLEILSGFPFDSGRFTNDDGMPLIRIRDLVNAYTEVNYGGPFPPDYIVVNGDVLIGMDGDFHVVRWKGGEALLNQRVLKVSERAQSGLDLDFSFYVLGPLMERVNNVTAATTVKHLSTKDVTNAIIKAPSKDTQRTIARILGTIDALIAQTEALIEKQRQIKQGMLHDLFTRGIDANGQLRSPQSEAPELYKETKLGWVPKEWEVVSLSEVCSLIKDGTHLPPPRTEEGPLLLGVVNIVEGKLRLVGNETHVSAEFYAQMHRTWEIVPGDVLLAIVGATIGKCTIAPDNLPQYTVQRSVAVLRGAVGKLRSDYLHQFILQPVFQTAIWNRVNQTAQPGIYLAEIGKLLIKRPKVDEQQAVASILLKAQARIDAEKENLEKLRLIKSGLMQDLLTGRVPVDHLVESLNERVATAANPS